MSIWKKMIFVFGLVVCSVVTIGCGPADFLQPLFRESDRVTLPGLEGVWQKTDAEVSKKECLVFEKQESNRYRFYLGEDQEEYEASLGCIGPDYFLEILPDHGIREDGRVKVILPAEGQRSSSSVVRITDSLCLTIGRIQPISTYPQELELLVTATRHILKLRLEGDVLEVAYCDKDTLLKMLNKGQARLDYSPGQELVTASTEDLQSFLLMYDRNPQSGLFAEMGTYRRIRQTEVDQ